MALRIARWAFMALLAGVILTVLAASGPTLIGRKTFIVLSGSMEPAIPLGSAVVTEPVRPTLLKEGDIITYVTPAEQFVTHRIIEVVQDDGGLGFRTQGDANTSPDPVVTRPPNVYGRMVYDVPWAGYILHYANQSATKLAVLVLAIMIVGWELQAWAFHRTAATQSAEKGASDPLIPEPLSSLSTPGTAQDKPSPGGAGSTQPEEGESHHAAQG